MNTPDVVTAMRRKRELREKEEAAQIQPGLSAKDYLRIGLRKEAAKEATAKARAARAEKKVIATEEETTSDGKS